MAEKGIKICKNTSNEAPIPNELESLEFIAPILGETSVEVAGTRYPTS